MGRRGMLALACFLATGLGCGRPAPVELRGQALGTFWSVAFVPSASARFKPTAEELRARIGATLGRVDRLFSTWREESEIARLNRAPASAPVVLSPELRRVVAASLDLARETAGAFDPTVGPLVALWGFGPRAARPPPSEQALARARERVGWRKLRFDAQGRLVRDAPGLELDLSAIAKGYAVDALVEELARWRPRGVLVEVGGEVRALGSRADGSPWRVGIQLPDAAPGELARVVRLTGHALATSGDYRQVREAGGKRWSHVIDPRTGRPAAAGVASASVIAPTCMEADAVATALVVLGGEAGIAWIEQRPWLEALLIIRREGKPARVLRSSGWQRWVEPPG